MNNKFLLTSILLLLSISVNAQFDNLGLTEKLYNEVKQLNQFLERFNYREDIKGNEIKNPDPIERQKYIAALFDVESIKKLNNPQKDSIRLFLEQVTNAKQAEYLEYHHDNWFAEVKGLVEYNGKEQEMSVLLKVKGNKSKGFEWLLSGANASFLTGSENSSHENIIPPNSNETNFMALGKAFEKKENLNKLIANDYSPDHLPQFIAALKDGSLKWKYSKKVTYHLLQIDNWIVKVDWFNRDSNNSGWLISKVIPFQNFLKPGYAHIILND